MSVTMAILALFLNMSQKECMEQCKKVENLDVVSACPAEVDPKACKQLKDNPPYKQCLEACAKLK